MLDATELVLIAASQCVEEHMRQRDQNNTVSTCVRRLVDLPSCGQEETFSPATSEPGGP